MSAIKSRLESRVILDFTSQKNSKNYIKKCLKKAEILELEHSEDFSNMILIENHIVVGMYKIHLLFSSLDAAFARNRLRDYGKFRVEIFELGQEAPINLKRDIRFKSELWVHKANQYKLSMKDLTDIIYLCHKMNHLKAFL